MGGKSGLRPSFIHSKEIVMAVVIITGTSKGIGFSTALTLARAGHTVYATMRDPVGSPQLAQAAARANLLIKISAMDVDSDSSVQAGFEAIYKAAGNIDVLINNAGIERSGHIEEVPMTEFRAVMETNYFGALRCIKAVIPQMRQLRSGTIVNISSVAGRVSTSPLGPYAASKHALEAVSEALAQEMKMFGVRVVIVEPGIIDTSMARGIGEPRPDSLYPHQRRMAHFFAATLRSARPTNLIAERILEIVESGTWQFRHPVGPGAEATISSRRATADEDYVSLHSADDDTWYKVMEQNTGLSIRPGD
jgi:NAD(P)-dependent dehydrogenase (short-subunit alcohol dehydrogenase family)